MSILLSLQAVGAQTAEQMPDLTAVTAPTEAEINVIDLAFNCLLYTSDAADD